MKQSRRPLIGNGAASVAHGPNVRKTGPGKYEPLSLATTTSMRVDRLHRALLPIGVRRILGKGGLSRAQRRADEQYGRLLISPSPAVRQPWNVANEEIEKVYWGRSDARNAFAISLKGALAP